MEARLWECHVLKSNQAGSLESCTHKVGKQHTENGNLGFLEQSYHSSENMAPLTCLCASDPPAVAGASPPVAAIRNSGALGVFGNTLTFTGTEFVRVSCLRLVAFQFACLIRLYLLWFLTLFFWICSRIGCYITFWPCVFLLLVHFDFWLF